ncbi:glycosyltransferase family 4 protein [Paraburkholderia rhizosphaerae]|uniref:Glycosyltransferase involved in cell wall biosynthesis n=1 Tax=Paraburkholderia rhizosphaerae TaxID=480658 RepID=A0A4R8LMZ9_9BURK|nr:glycosyltransferase family 4 protein [Paraburkholderia rhizosphaerae]TDY47628.1 glycosyltransferase involved in cell wall biosynthesis [Paraburkholderia rhizosphaerae]
MKIGLSSNALKHSGGLERYAMDLVRGFVAAGVTPAFFARRFDKSLPETSMVEAHRINVSFLPGKLRDGWFSRRLRAARRAAGVDVLIGCNRVDSSEIAICGGTHLGFLRATGKRHKRSDVRQIALERRQYDNAQLIVAHSQLMRDELRELYRVPESKIEVLYPPVDDARFSPVGLAERAALRRKFGFADHEIVLLFPSSSHQRKGLSLIEAALDGVDGSLVLAVAGRAPESSHPRVRYIGYVKDIEDAYRAADFTILASKYEPFGLVGIESVMCGTPVIFPATLGCCAAIAPHAKHVFAPDDVADLRATLTRIVRQREQAPSAMPALPAELARGAVLYDARVASHVDALLRAAQRVVVERR